MQHTIYYHHRIYLCAHYLGPLIAFLASSEGLNLFCHDLNFLRKRPFSLLVSAGSSQLFFWVVLTPYTVCLCVYSRFRDPTPSCDFTMRQVKLLSPQVNNFILLFSNFRFSRHLISISVYPYGTLLWPSAAAYDRFSIPTVKLTITRLRL